VSIFSTVHEHLLAADESESNAYAVPAKGQFVRRAASRKCIRKPKWEQNVVLPRAQNPQHKQELELFLGRDGGELILQTGAFCLSPGFLPKPAPLKSRVIDGQ
jgi:hypothetical protein